MSLIQIFAVEVFLLTLLLVKLSMDVIKLRRSLRIVLGDAQNEHLIRAITAQSNFLNYVPMALIIQLALVYLHINQWVFVLIIVMLVLGRILHALSIKKFELQKNYRFRIFSMQLTLYSLILSSGVLLVSVFFTL